ncbi:hypothetical protein SG34_023390 [Thalassomonas viridans]|uniref:Uncharacterized protein n=1 Tax=Thalassomonas viridans TaxID=137584 RepID=A0AAE9Z0A0_9GAMM|nr:hypothetical protein [Thalassomonas viridans]WDE04255.1 hypothetical protein SG34_023390 [Thalassomonas viridans]
MSENSSLYQFTVMAIDNLVTTSEYLMQKIDECEGNDFHQSYLEQYRQIMKAAYELLNNLPALEQDMVRTMLASDIL